MTENNTQAAECLSHLTAELGTTSDESIMCVCDANGNTIDVLIAGKSEVTRLSFEVLRLKAVIEREAEYCYGWAASAEMMGDDDRAKRHRERGDRLRSCV